MKITRTKKPSLILDESLATDLKVKDDFQPVADMAETSVLISSEKAEERFEETKKEIEKTAEPVIEETAAEHKDEVFPDKIEESLEENKEPLTEEIDVVDRKALAELIKECYENKIPFSVKRSVKEGFRYALTKGKTEALVEELEGETIDALITNGTCKDVEDAKEYIEQTKEEIKEVEPFKETEEVKEEEKVEECKESLEESFGVKFAKFYESSDADMTLFEDLFIKYDPELTEDIDVVVDSMSDEDKNALQEAYFTEKKEEKKETPFEKVQRALAKFAVKAENLEEDAIMNKNDSTGRVDNRNVEKTEEPANNNILPETPLSEEKEDKDDVDNTDLNGAVVKEYTEEPKEEKDEGLLVPDIDMGGVNLNVDASGQNNALGFGGSTPKVEGCEDCEEEKGEKLDEEKDEEEKPTEVQAEEEPVEKTEEEVKVEEPSDVEVEVKAEIEPENLDDLVAFFEPLDNILDTDITVEEPVDLEAKYDAGDLDYENMVDSISFVTADDDNPIEENKAFNFDIYKTEEGKYVAFGNETPFGPTEDVEELKDQIRDFMKGSEFEVTEEEETFKVVADAKEEEPFEDETALDLDGEVEEETADEVIIEPEDEEVEETEVVDEFDDEKTEAEEEDEQEELLDDESDLDLASFDK